jgi:Na+/H+ antiporter NhaD/arsenite permease-like protein
VSVHFAGIAGLLTVFIIGTTRPINLGVLAIAMTFVVGTFAGEAPRAMYAGFPVDLFVLLTGVTYLFGIAVQNGTVAWLVDTFVAGVGGRRALVPWVVFIVAALPAMAGALGSTGVALLAPLAMRLGERCEIDRRMVGLMVVHGAAAGNFSPLNVLGAMVHQAVTSRGLAMSVTTLFVANLVCNIVLGAVIVWLFRGVVPSVSSESRRAAASDRSDSKGPVPSERSESREPAVARVFTLLALLVVAVVSLGFGLSIGFVAFCAAAVLHLAFPTSSNGAERHIAWGVVLLVCGVVMYVAALQRYGTVTAVGEAITAMGQPLFAALLLCAIGAVTSAFASSAGILGAIIPLAAPLMMQGLVDTTAFVVALALSATLVDATPFSTVGALAVANASEPERKHVYRGMLAWGAAMVIVAPLLTWLVFVVPRG